MKKRVAICCPTRERPSQPWLDAVERSVPFLEDYEHATVFEVGCPYVSGARATMLRKAMLWGAEIFLFLDDDVSFEPDALVKLIETDGDVVSGTYRFKCDEEAYMGSHLQCEDGRTAIRQDGCIEMLNIPAGFLKVTIGAIHKFMEAFPELTIWRDNDGFKSADLFNHGAYNGTWFGEDYAFSRRWREIGGQIWLIPNLNLTHHGKDKDFPGNYHDYMMRLSA